MSPRIAHDRRVAIVGAGPGGIVAARYLLAHGFDPVLFEQSSSLGGQWNAGALHSGVWPGMAVNTSCVTTQFSDLPWPQGTAMFPHHREVLAYLERYSSMFRVTPCIRFGERVTKIAPDGSSRWRIVSTNSSDGRTRSEVFSRVILASGRYCAPKTPQIPGLEDFRGHVAHTFAYRGPEPYRGQRVLIAGGAISATEIAPDLAMGGAARVLSAMRRQRYVLQRVVAGVPLDLLLFTRYGFLARERLPAETLNAEFLQFVARTSGLPEQWGGLPAHPDPTVAGITHGQFYLPLVAERRILPKPWIRSLAPRTVTFEDGSEEEVDAIFFATGYRLHLPFAGAELLRLIGAGGPALQLYRHTFHPQLPGLAFLGLFHQSGPYFVPLELQARWIAYTWSGLCREPSAEEMAKEVAAMPAPSERPVPMHERCISFARDAGVEPDPERWPELQRALLFGPLAPVSFRLSGPDALPDAGPRVAAAAAEFGAITSHELTPEERLKLDKLSRLRLEAAQ